MSYTFDSTPVLARPANERDDDEQWATVTQPASLVALDFSGTQPTTMDADQLRRDLIASQCQAPRIPRKRSPVLSADSPDGTSNQGRVRPTEGAGDIPQAGYGLLWWACMLVMACISVAFALAC